MRTIITTSCLFIVCIACMSQSCNKRNKPCRDNVICTEIFAMVTVHVTEANDQNAILSDAYTIRKSTGEEIRIEQTMPNGSYIVLDDNYQKKLANSTDTFTFIGIKDNKEVVKEQYAISADCCHISKLSGNTEATTH